jgi:S1-C subfamily serine protease
MTALGLGTLLAAGLFLSGQSQSFSRYFINAAKTSSDSVVNIVVYSTKDDNGLKEEVKTAYASGTVVSEGYIATNYHVVTKGDKYHVFYKNGIKIHITRFPDGRYYLADPKTDIALLRISPEYHSYPPPIAFSDSSRLKEGEWVLAIGNPYGLGRSITAGIVSSTGRDDIGYADIEDFIQTDASINPGNSGGPLVDLSGKLVGINTAIRSSSGAYQGISFAIPSNIVNQVCTELIKFGRVRRGWIGFMARDSRSRSHDMPSVSVIAIIKNSPAEQAGLKEGDIILSVDGNEISNIGSLLKIIGNKPIESNLGIIISRDGKKKKIKLLLREKFEYKKIRDALDGLFDRYGIEVDENADTGRVIISHVSPAAIDRDIKMGDVIHAINGSKTVSLKAFISVLKKNQNAIYELRLERDGAIYTVDFSKEGTR